MQHYKLLRSNRESGPLGFQELIGMPLKAYDLVWVEGKSTSWKYPSEIEELKEYAPPAPEDLYVQYHTANLNSLSNSFPDTGSVAAKMPRNKYVSIILPAIPKTNTPIQEVPSEIINNFSVDNTIAYTDSNIPKQKGRYYVAGASLILLASAIYFGTVNKAGFSSPVSPPNTPILSNSSLTNSVSSSFIPSGSPPINLQFAALQRFVSVKPNNYETGFFGGISDLSLTITNTGKTDLHNIAVSVDFIETDKSVHHTEVIRVISLKAGKSSIVDVPVSKFGIAIQTKIISINGLFSQ